MAASPPTTWVDSIAGFKLTDIGPNALARTFELAIQDKEAKDETSVGNLSYEKGVPSSRSNPNANPRFAGDALIGGINGEFGAATNDKDRKNVQDSLLKWTQQFSAGPFGLSAPEPVEGPPPTGPANGNKKG